MRGPWTLIVPEGMNTDVEVVFNNILEMAMARAFESPPSKTLEPWFGLPVSRQSCSGVGLNVVPPLLQGQKKFFNSLLLKNQIRPSLLPEMRLPCPRVLKWLRSKWLRNWKAYPTPYEVCTVKMQYDNYTQRIHDELYEYLLTSLTTSPVEDGKNDTRTRIRRRFAVAENNKLAGESNYAIWRNVFETKIVLVRAADIIGQRRKTLPEDIDKYSSEVEIWRYKLRHVWEALYDSLKQDVMSNVQVALTSLGGMGDPVTPWEWLEDTYQTHAEDFQHKFFQRITTISINECGGDIVTHVTNWRKAVENLTRRGWELPDSFLRQRFLSSIDSHASYFVQNFLIDNRRPVVIILSN
ncbi:hypothetical protein FQN51_001769 [Onygenales sp. PD_10]|nr:hypothetical protein FQN51_001769 [Onygenales sp. PD_10]